MSLTPKHLTITFIDETLKIVNDTKDIKEITNFLLDLRNNVSEIQEDENNTKPTN